MTTAPFDSEKVRRGHYYFNDIGADESEPWVDAVKASDYDALLALTEELCDKALEAERLLREMTADRDLWQQAHDEDCPNKALVETLEAEIARLKGDR